MSIKQSIALMFVIFGVSFSASAKLIKITNAYATNIETGTVMTVSAAVSNVVGSCVRDGYRSRKWTQFVRDRGVNLQFKYNYYTDASCSNLDGSSNGYIHYSVASECPAGTDLNPSTGICDAPCGGDQIRDPETGECKEVPFCERDSTIDQIFSAEQSCAQQNGVFSFQCDNGDQLGIPQGLSTKCAQPNACVLGMLNWPECLGDLDPTDPLDKPDSDFDSGTAAPITPDTPSFDKDTPDAVTPTDTTDTAVLQAVQNLNQDTNQALSAIDSDMTDGFNDVNERLNQLNQTNDAIGQSITDQMNQDYQIHLAQKELALQNTGAINNGFDKTGQALTQLSTSMADQSTAVTDSINTLPDKLASLTPCDPNSDPRSCEGQTGMTSGLAENINTQVNDAVSEGFDDVEVEMVDAVQGFIDNSRLQPVKGYMHEAVGIAMSALPKIQDCTPFSIPTPFWGDVSFGCEFSVKFKAVASFLIYIYTIWSLVDILLNGVTPAAGTVPHRSRGI